MEDVDERGAGRVDCFFHYRQILSAFRAALAALA